MTRWDATPRRRRSALPLGLLLVAVVAVIALALSPRLFDRLGGDGPGAGGGGGALVIPDAADEPVSSERATVVRVVDGDTLVVRREGAGAGSGSTSEERVRMVGVDTPESVKPDSPEECFGREASSRTAELLPEGTTVLLEPDRTQGDRDRYDRLLRYVWVLPADSVAELVSLRLVAEGYAEAYRDRHARWQQFAEAQAAAADARLGLWSAC